MESYSSYSSSDTDGIPDFSTNTGSSGYGHSASRSIREEKIETKEDKCFERYTRRLSRDDLMNKIKDMVTGINKQEKYLKHQAEKQQRNKQLIDHLTSLTENDRKDTEHKKKECERLGKERARYAETIQKYRKDKKIKSSSARFVMAQRLNEDLTKQKKLLENKRDWLRRQEKGRGIDDEAINEYVSAQRLLAREQEKKENLAKKMMWYEKEIAKAKQERDSKKLGTSYKADDPLPAISKKPTNFVSERVDDVAVVSNITDIIKQKDGYVDELHGTTFIPRPPELPRSENRTVNRFRRKLRPSNY